MPGIVQNIHNHNIFLLGNGILRYMMSYKTCTEKIYIFVIFKIDKSHSLVFRCSSICARRYMCADMDTLVKSENTGKSLIVNQRG